MKKIKKILVPTDLSELSLSAIEYARSLADVYGAKLYFLHAVEVVPVVSFPTVDFTLETALNDEVEKARELMEHLLSDSLKNVADISVNIRRGVAFDEIMRFIEQEDIDLVVMATHGRTGLPHIIMGSVAEKVVRHSPVPVLTVKPQKMQKMQKKTSPQAKARELELS
jgi:nucleotide-binding universal stress UspA family protein